jgi:hypothetical protein
MSRRSSRRTLASLTLAGAAVVLAAASAAAAPPPALPGDAVPAEPSAPAGLPDRPAAVLRSVKVGARLRIAIDCRAGGTVEVATRDRRPLARRRFACSHGHARLGIRPGRRLKAALAEDGRSLMATLKAGGTELRMPLLAGGRAVKPTARLSAYEPSASAYCYGRTTGGGYVVVSLPQYATFGQARINQLVQWRPWLYWQDMATGRTGWWTNVGWQSYSVMANGATSSGYGYGNVVVVGGTSVPGEAYRFVLGVGARTWAAPAIETSINGRSDLTWVTPWAADWPSFRSGGWCGFN